MIKMGIANTISNNSGMSNQNSNSQSYVDPINYHIKISTGDFCFISMIILILIIILLIPTRRR